MTAHLIRSANGQPCLILDHNGGTVRPAVLTAGPLKGVAIRQWRIPKFWPARPDDVQITPLPASWNGVISAPVGLWRKTNNEAGQTCAPDAIMATRVLPVWEIYRVLKAMVA